MRSWGAHADLFCWPGGVQDEDHSSFAAWGVVGGLFGFFSFLVGNGSRELSLFASQRYLAGIWRCSPCNVGLPVFQPFGGDFEQKALFLSFLPQKPPLMRPLWHKCRGECLTNAMPTVNIPCPPERAVHGGRAISPHHFFTTALYAPMF